jgi:hypothetical protein
VGNKLTVFQDRLADVAESNMIWCTDGASQRLA